MREAAEGCARAGIPWIGLWRDKVAETGLEESASIVRETGLKVSSLCRGGMFPATTKRERLDRLDDNRRAVDEAATLGTDVLVLVCGAAPGRDLRAARDEVEEAIETLAPYADEAGINLGIEPLHPAFAADRSVVCTLGEANGIVRRVGSPRVGVVIDAYHVWWDADLYTEIGRASGSILGFHVDDWPRGGGDPLLSRGMMGDGVIGLRRMREAVEDAGYEGPVEVEIFNEAIWAKPGEEVLETMKRRYLEHVLGEVPAGGSA
nr:sugar phosphate isomerase/epimerase family protein [Rubrobacter tropicus]